MTFSVKHGTCTERDKYAQNNKNTTGEYYGFTCYVNSIQMAEPITATFHFYHNCVEKTVSKEYSVKEYFEAFDEALNNGTITDENGKMENLVHALADYGHYVQPFLANERHWTLGTDYARLYTSYTDNYDITASDVSDKAIIVSNPTGGDIEKITYSLTLDSDTAINVYFKPKAGYSGSFKATVAGVDAAYTKSGSRYCVKIDGIAAHELSNTYEIIVKTDNNTSTVKLSALSYVNSALNYYNDTNDEGSIARNAVAALYEYSKAADSYKPAP